MFASDGRWYPCTWAGHVSVSFAGKTTGQGKAISKRLHDFAVTRGWQFGPVEEIS